MRGDRGDIVVGWLTKMALVIIAFGLVGFDAIAIGIAHLSGADQANSAARAAVEVWQGSHNVDAAYRAALADAESHEATIRPGDFEVLSNGDIRLTVRREATTLLVYRLGATKKWAQIAEQVTVSSSIR